MSEHLRDLLAERARLVAEAQAILDKAEAEGRDTTEEEHAAYVELVGEGETTGKVGELDARIEKNIAEREQLRQAAEKKFKLPGEKVEKPEATPKSMKRAEYDKLSPGEQRAFLQTGKVED